MRSVNESVNSTTSTTIQSLPWRVVQTRSRSEKKAAAVLEGLGMQVYLPLQKRKKQWSDRVKVVEEPLFSGYLFVRFSEAQRYPMLNCAGVVRIVSFGGTYAYIPESQINALKKMDYLDYEIEVVDSELIVGSEVLITSGPFKNQSGRLIRHNDKGKLLIEIAAIGKGILLELGRTRVVNQHTGMQQVSK